MPDENSDVDVCIVTDLSGKRKIDLIREIRRECRSFFSYPLDILVYSEKEFFDRASLSGTLEYQIAHEGKAFVSENYQNESTSPR